MAAQIIIPPDLQALVDKRLATGAYDNAEDVLRQALEAQDADQDDCTSEERVEISAHVEEGFQQAQRGELFDEDQVSVHLAEFKGRWLLERQKS